MRFLTGVAIGIAAAAAAAAWYLSRSGQQFREEYQLEGRLGEFGDQIDTRAREVQAQVMSQVNDIVAKAQQAGDAAAETTSDTADQVTAAVSEAAESGTEDAGGFAAS